MCHTSEAFVAGLLVHFVWDFMLVIGGALGFKYVQKWRCKHKYDEPNRALVSRLSSKQMREMMQSHLYIIDNQIVKSRWDLTGRAIGFVAQTHDEPEPIRVDCHGEVQSPNVGPRTFDESPFNGDTR